MTSPLGQHPASERVDGTQPSSDDLSDPLARREVDGRMAPAAVVAWLVTATFADASPGLAWSGAALLVAVSAIVWWTSIGWRSGVLICLTIGAAAAAICGTRGDAHRSGPVAELARERAEVSVALQIRDDPRTERGRFGAYVLARAQMLELTGRGHTWRVRAPVLVIADSSWSHLQWGERVRGYGRLSAAQGNDLAAIASMRGTPVQRHRASWLYRATQRYRAAIKESAAPLGAGERALVPALVDGDESRISPRLADDFTTTGLTHLLAVSGSNLTLVLGFVLTAGRWLGVRGRAQPVLAVVTVAGFVVLARPDPSVLRAAAMGLVTVAGLCVGGGGHAARSRGIRILCVAVVVLLLLDPGLARSPGFILSSSATAGIVVFAPSWRDRLGTWLPGWLAESVAVPLAAQLSCTPAVAAISGQVSLIAVVANLLAGPAVGPATVLGLMAGAVTLMAPALGHLVGWCAAVPASWIVYVAQRGGELPGASAPWPTGLIGLGVLVAGCVATAIVLPRVLDRRAVCLALSGALVVAVVHPLSGATDGTWVMAVCDVGQGDAIALNAGHGRAVMVDAGPDPVLVDRCLRRLDIHGVPLVVLTHFHADHVDGLSGVLRHRGVGRIEVSPYRQPAAGVVLVDRLAHRARIAIAVPPVGTTWSVGQVTLRVVGPIDRAPPASGNPNDASVVMVADVRGVRILLAGDAQAEEMDDLMRTGAALRCDVYKVAHHGSANVDPAFVAETHARLAVISVGRHNDYGHPAPSALSGLRRLGAQVRRTDLDGTILVEVSGRRLVTQTSQ
jgi:competence protein ComEC